MPISDLGMLIEALAGTHECIRARPADRDGAARSDEDVEVPDLDIRSSLVMACRLDDQEHALAVLLQLGTPVTQARIAHREPR